MKHLYFMTGNAQKFGMGNQVCQQYGITLEQQSLDIDEVQSEDTEYVARQKATAAYQALGQPVIISDDAWAITGLRGFPGTYAKSVNSWFTPDDYIRLTKDLSNREIILIQTLVYQDGISQLVFTRETSGVLLKEPRGEAGVSIQKVVSFDDSQASISEMIGSNSHYSGSAALEVWEDFAKWYTESNHSS